MVVKRPTANCGRHSLTIREVSTFLISPLLAVLDVAQRADVVALGDGLGQLQPCVEALADAVVAAHGDVAEPGDLLIGAAGLLPRLDQRAVVEIQIQGVVGVLHQIHLKDPAGRLGEQRLAQTLQALGIPIKPPCTFGLAIFLLSITCLISVHSASAMISTPSFFANILASAVTLLLVMTTGAAPLL